MTKVLGERIETSRHYFQELYQHRLSQTSGISPCRAACVNRRIFQEGNRCYCTFRISSEGWRWQKHRCRRNISAFGDLHCIESEKQSDVPIVAKKTSKSIIPHNLDPNGSDCTGPLLFRWWRFYSRAVRASRRRYWLKHLYRPTTADFLFIGAPR